MEPRRRGGGLRWARNLYDRAGHEWLERQADGLAAASGVAREDLELAPAEIETLLDLAGVAAHESGARTNAPLLCYLLGRARVAGAGLDELAETVRSTS